MEREEQPSKTRLNKHGKLAILATTLALIGGGSRIAEKHGDSVAASEAAAAHVEKQKTQDVRHALEQDLQPMGQVTTLKGLYEIDPGSVSIRDGHDKMGADDKVELSDDVLTGGKIVVSEPIVVEEAPSDEGGYITAALPLKDGRIAFVQINSDTIDSIQRADNGQPSPLVAPGGSSEDRITAMHDLFAQQQESIIQEADFSDLTTAPLIKTTEGQEIGKA